jgi:O-antigen/teichoic acid export membrane protein
MAESTPLTLRQRIFKAGAWTAVGYFVSQIIRFGSNLLMTRLLVPEMFGVMSIASMVMYGLALISDVGLGPNVVHSKRGNDALFLNTAWAIQIRRGVVIWLFALGVSFCIVVANRIGAVPVASVYAKQQLPYVIAVLSFGAAISGFESTKLFEASRNLLIHRVTQIEITSQVAGLLCMLAWVAINRSIWSLVAGSICSASVRTILSHVRLPGHANRWQWDHAAFHEIIHFGKWIFLSSILGFLINSGDRILLGGMLTAASLGVYAIAYLMTNSVENVIAKMITDVSFPALSEVLRERPTQLKASYYRFHAIIAAFTYSAAGILMVSGQALIGMIYDQRYSQAGWMLEILAAALIAIPFRLAPYCFQALGMPKLLSHIIAIRLITMFLVTPIGYHFFGLRGALWSIVLSGFAGLPLTIFYAIKYGLFDLRRELKLLPLVPAGMILGKLFDLAVAYWLPHSGRHLLLWKFG